MSPIHAAPSIDPEELRMRVHRRLPDRLFPLRPIVALAGLLIASQALPAVAQYADTSGELGIQVRQGRKPLPGVEVRMRSQDAPGLPEPAPVTTDAEGRATVFGLAPGLWRVDLYLGGKAAYLMTVRVFPDRRAEELGSPARDVDAPDLSWRFFKVTAAPPAPVVRPERPQPRPAPPSTPAPTPPSTPEPERARPPASRPPAGETPVSPPPQERRRRPPAQPPASEPERPAPLQPPAPSGVQPSPTPSTAPPAAAADEPQAEPAPPETGLTEPTPAEPTQQATTADAGVPPEETAPAEPVPAPPSTPAAQEEPQAEPAPPETALTEPTPAEPTQQAAAAEAAAAEAEPSGAPPSAAEPTGETIAPLPVQPPKPAPESPETAVPPRRPPAPEPPPEPAAVPPPYQGPPPEQPALEPQPEPRPELQPEPAPPPEPAAPPAAEPTPAPPRLPPAEPMPPRVAVRSGRGGDCPDCRPEESAVSVARDVAGGGSLAGSGECGPSMASAARQAARRLAASGALVSGPAALDGGEVSGFTGAGESCQLFGVVLPAGVRYRGFGLAATQGGEGGVCRPEKACPVGAAIWPARPVIEQLEGGETLVYTVFRNSADSLRRAELTVYYIP